MIDTAVGTKVDLRSHDRSSRSPTGLQDYLAWCRELVLEEIRDIMPQVRYGAGLYELMLDYPLRGGKALRPALCIATCRAAGGQLQSVLRSAAVLELYHNAFLIHDDVEDGSELRRSDKTLHCKVGVPAAVNVGDGMLALSLPALMDNIEIIGVGRTLRIQQTISRMALESAEGQMMELDWIRKNTWSLTDRDYIRMVYKKTTWYTFIAPVWIAGIAARMAQEQINDLVRFVSLLGIAFQIQDDVLNLRGDPTQYGKEISGDLWEGKHTLILIHTLRSLSRPDRDHAIDVLAKQRPPVQTEKDVERQHRLAQLEEWRARGEVGGEAYAALRRECEEGEKEKFKTLNDVLFLRDVIERCDGLAYASRVAHRHVTRAARKFQRIARRLPASEHRDFLHDLVEFVVRRTS